MDLLAGLTERWLHAPVKNRALAGVTSDTGSHPIVAGKCQSQYHESEGCTREHRA